METHRELQMDGLWPLLERAFDGVVLLVPAPWQVARANPVAAECLGATERELIGRRAVELFDDGSRIAAMELVQRAWVGQADSESVYATLVSDSGAFQRIELRARALTFKGERFVGLVFRGVAVGDRAAMGEFHRVDPLTGLRDRDFLAARLSALLRNREKSDRAFAVLFVDLDNFKAVNDRWGHIVGDRVLSEAARRLAACVGTDHPVIRYGGDEFTVLVDSISDVKEVETLAECIRTSMSPPIALPKGEVTLSASVGIAFASPEFRTPEDVIAAADRAMYAAKRGK